MSNAAIRHDDGQYALDCWIEAEDEGESAATEYCDAIAPLRARAAIILKAGRFRYLELSRWNAALDDWDTLEVFEPGG